MLNNKTEGFAETKEKVIDSTDIVEVNDIIRFHGNEYYHIVSGKTNKDIKQFVFVPITEDKEKKDEYIIIDQDDILSHDSIKRDWQNNCNDCNLIKIIPAIIEENPLWEITYTDDSNRYVMDYVSIYDGSQYEQLRLRKTFK
ncbi:DUF5590 domain-containing protein [Ornithinibacillus salinisoli]